VSNVPAVKIKIEVETLNALPRVQPPPTPLKVINASGAMATPFVVIVRPVDVDVNVILPVELHTVPANSDMEPRTFSVGDVPVANVTVPADTVMSRQAKAPVIVTV
jgi:hypothetical protein